MKLGRVAGLHSQRGVDFPKATNFGKAGLCARYQEKEAEGLAPLLL